MKNQFKFIALAACVALSAGFASCSDDDNDIKPGNTAQVFPQGVPSSVDGMTVKTNANGQVTEIIDGDATISFQYGSFSRAQNFQAKMTIHDPSYPEDDTEFYFQLNNKGFVTYALEVYTGDEDNSQDEWWFGYNADGQLNYMKRTEGDNEVTTITYNGGNITSTSTVDDDNTTPSVYDITYTDATVTTALANNGGLMLFDETFGIDMDEMGAAYFAGLLGKATKNLPVKLQRKGDNEYDTFAWTLNAKGLPVKLVSTTHYGESSYSDEYTFAW